MGKSPAKKKQAEKIAKIEKNQLSIRLKYIKIGKDMKGVDRLV